jgi:ParB family transcriptional regulator, chromosome partitioning protein
MHPAAQLIAFRRLFENGKSIADIAASFGVTESVVSRRLALARVSPLLLAKYRAGELNLELLQAFTVSEDHAAQEAVWEQLPSYNRHSHAVRRLLLAGDMPATDRLARFVGIPIYEAAGGIVRRDLFAEGEQGTYICDPIKLTQLANEKLAAAAEELRADGWKWVEGITQGIDHSILRRFEKVEARNAPLPDQTKTQLEELERQRDCLAEQIKEADEEDENPELEDKLQAIEESIEAIQQNRPRQYAKKTKSHCGVCVGIRANGDFEFVYGLMRKEDRPRVDDTEASSFDGDAESSEATTLEQKSEEEGNESTDYSAALMVSLTQEKTAAIAAELTQQPRIALAAVVYTFALSQFRLDLDFYRSYSSLQLTTRQANLDGAASSRAVERLTTQRQNWLAQFPSAAAELWPWCLAQTQDRLLELLAFCAAAIVDGVVLPHKDSSDAAKVEHANQLAAALQMDMRDWFTPTVENFFGRVSKLQIANALTEAGNPLQTQDSKSKKGELAAIAAKKINGTGWLPEPLRISSSESAGEANG